MSITRRDFVTSTALASGAAVAALQPGMAAAAETNSRGMPMRPLGNTGEKVTILAFGCGSRFLAYENEDEADRVLNQAIDLGIGYLDTAQAYGDGHSETRVGRVMKTRRKEVFLSTKIQLRNADAAMKRFEESLKLLNTDHVDLVHVHALMGDEDLAAIEAPNGVLKTVYKLRDQKMTRFIGITCHAYPTVLAKALERHDFNCTQMALNAALAGMTPPAGRGGFHRWQSGGFEEVALPVANRKGIGVIAMKVYGQEHLNGEATAEELVRYSLSLPVSAAVAGMPKVSYLEENVRIAKAFKPFDKATMRRMSSDLASRKKVAMDRFFVNHRDV
ncbi:MAG: aldo/keto reductase [Bryobacterales bacterium]|nr:aldo/keto reductase [Bryobacterales bacterium]